MTVRCAHGCATPLSSLSDAGVTLYFCTTCHGTFCPGDGVTRWLMGAASEPPRPGRAPSLWSRPSQRARARGSCPDDGSPMAAIKLAHGGQALRCERCQGMFVAAGMLPEVRATFARKSRAPRPSGPLPSSRPKSAAESEERQLVGDRLSFEEPWILLLALPCALLLSYAVSLSELGRLVLYPVQLQFHELGHALFAWLSSRSALPLPFGFTFWRIEQSRFTGACMLFLLGVLAYRGYLERRKFALALSGALLVAFVVLSLVVSPDTSLMLMLVGGIAGEFILSCMVLVAFFFPLPDRLRWDFFRFVLLLPAAGTWVASARLWLDVSRGLRPLPMGSILGTTGDGSGDLDRLIAQHGFTPASITHLYLSLAGLTATILALTYGWFALRGLAALRRSADA